MSYLKFIFCFWIITTWPIDHYDQDLESKTFWDAPVLFVSLGSSCEIPHLLREHSMRQAAFPLDWVISIDQEGLMKCLDEDFLHFTDESCLTPKQDGILVNFYYKMEFPHEGSSFSTPYRVLLEKFKSKYKRRIERFREIGNYKGFVYFFRASYDWATSSAFLFPDEGNLHIEMPWAEELEQKLKKRFPQLKFHLIIANHHTALKAKLERWSEGISILWHNPKQEHAVKIESVREAFSTLR
jgi:hypothetical protein